MTIKLYILISKYKNSINKLDIILVSIKYFTKL